MTTFLQTKTSREQWLDRIEKKSDSHGSRRVASAVLKNAEDLCQDKYTRSLDEVVQELERVSDERAIAIFLQSFVDKLYEKGFKDTQIQGYLGYLRQYMRARGVVVSEDVRAEISIPNTPIEPRVGVERSQIRDHILKISSEKYITLMLFLVSSGCRIQEAMHVKVRDLEFLDQGIIQVNLKAEYTKGKKLPRTTFVSKETTPFVRKLIRNMKPHQTIFTDKTDAEKASKLAITWFWKFKKSHGLTEKYDTSNHDKFTFHSLRAFFETIVSDNFSFEASHAFLGHRKYMITYYRKSPNQRVDDYLSFEHLLHVLDDGVTSEDVKDRDEVIRNLEGQLQRERQEHHESEKTIKMQMFELKKIVEEMAQKIDCQSKSQIKLNLDKIVEQIPLPSVRDLYSEGAGLDVIGKKRFASTTF